MRPGRSLARQLCPPGEKPQEVLWGGPPEAPRAEVSRGCDASCSIRFLPSPSSQRMPPSQLARMAHGHASLCSLLLLMLCDGAAAWGGTSAMPHHGQACSAVQQQRQQQQQRRQQLQPVMMAGRGGGRGRFRGPPVPVKDTTPINGAIPYDEMRVMLDAGGGTDEMLGIMSKDEALEAARERELDLVLIAEKSNPPVVKIVSYDKFRFAREKKRKEQQKAASRGKSELKELKMSYKIGEHDYGVRKKQAMKFLNAGDKVKFSMLFRGREVTHADVGKQIMLRMAGELEELGALDSPPKGVCSCCLHCASR